MIERSEHNVLLQKLKSREFENEITIITLPFRWTFLRAFLEYFITLILKQRFKHRILEILAIVVSTPFLILFFVSHTLLVGILSAIIYPAFRVGSMLFVILNLDFVFSHSYLSQFLVWFHLFGLLFFLALSFYVMTNAIQCLLVGLFLNLFLFIPYFAYLSVVAFYCCSYWKTIEEKYFVLKRLIYEVCRDKQCVNNGCIPNRLAEQNEEVLPVVSKDLYDEIRKELLPYNTNLFYFGLKMFCLALFSFGISKLIAMLTVLHITNLIPIVTTAILGIMPHLFNMEALKMSEERKKAREEKLKLIVKRRVDELVGKKPKLVRTVLIMVQDSDTKDKENIERYEHVKSGFDLNTPDYVEGPELEKFPVQEFNDATTDENVQISKYVKARSDLNPFDSDDLAFVTVHSPPATETPMTADDRTADDTAADDRTADHRTADHRTTDENFRVRADLNPSGNDDVENPELRGTISLIQENNVTTDEEYFQDFERVRARSDSDDVIDEVEENILRETIL